MAIPVVGSGYLTFDVCKDAQDKKHLALLSLSKSYTLLLKKKIYVMKLYPLLCCTDDLPSLKQKIAYCVANSDLVISVW